MHSIILVTALTATSGIFGGGRQQQCTTGQCPNAYAQTAYYRPAPATCTTGTCPQTYAAAAPAAQYYQAPAAQPMMSRRGGWLRTNRVAYYNTSCPNGQCYRR